MLSNIQTLLARYSWLLLLALLIIMYALGAGIARYLGALIDPGVYLLGQLITIALFLGIYLLDRTFDIQVGVETMGRMVFRFLPYRSALLLGGILFATIAAAAAVPLIWTQNLSSGSFFMLVSGVSLGVFYAVPPTRLSDSGYGELTMAILLANIVPAFSFNLQFGGFHRLLTMTTAPLSLLALAMTIVFALPEYATQIKYQKKTLVTRLGWQNAMLVHNLLILGAFLLLALAAAFDLPGFALYPALLPLPLGAFQVWYMNRIAGGAAPNWLAMKVSAAGLLAFMVYALTFAFWTH